MDANILFYMISFLIIIFSLSVLLNPNPIMSSLYLVISMIGVAFLFFMLKAAFLAGVQLAVYAGAVMVLFVMVLMIFDLNIEKSAFSKGTLSKLIKFLTGAGLLGFVSYAILSSKDVMTVDEAKLVDFNSKQLAEILFTDYLFAFELLGVILLVIAIGAVALSRIKGGTHAK